MSTRESRWTLEIGRYCVLAALVFFMAKMPVRAQDLPPVFNPPKSHYLALGDSIAYGYQAFKFVAGLPPSAYNTGYVDVFATRLRQIQPAILTINYGCPGESTGSFVSGPCLWSATGHELRQRFFRQSTAGCHRVLGRSSRGSEPDHPHTWGK